MGLHTPNPSITQTQLPSQGASDQHLMLPKQQHSNQGQIIGLWPYPSDIWLYKFQIIDNDQLESIMIWYNLYVIDKILTIQFFCKINLNTTWSTIIDV